ncbi:MAG: galactose mutarotase, partial [Flavihumibacter sp.]|nr:galactose mutarotase [Flavihumibacter sp.]
KVIWTAAPVVDSLPSLKLSYLSKDGEEGYPGNLQVTVTYTLTEEDGLKIQYEATTDQATPVNLTNHSYFNLTGDTKETIFNHQLQLNADAYTPVDNGLIPTGEIRQVAGTPFDFRSPMPIGSRIDSVPGGYDHNYVLNNTDGSLRKIAHLSEPVSGRFLEVWTTEPGVQFYSGNFLDGKFSNHTGTPVQLHTALCLETQHFPDSPNKKEFPSTILEPGKKYYTETVYKVGVSK